MTVSHGTRDHPLHFANAAEWEFWLEQNSASEDQAWLLIAKKGSGLESVAIRDALDSALCFGWIDGPKRMGGGMPPTPPRRSSRFRMT